MGAVPSITGKGGGNGGPPERPADGVPGQLLEAYFKSSAFVAGGGAGVGGDAAARDSGWVGPAEALLSTAAQQGKMKVMAQSDRALLVELKRAGAWALRKWTAARNAADGERLLAAALAAESVPNASGMAANAARQPILFIPASHGGGSSSSSSSSSTSASSAGVTASAPPLPPRFMLSCFLGYERACLAGDCIDLTDCVRHALRLVQESPDARAYISHAYRVVIVDEFQDTSVLQHALLYAILGATSAMSQQQHQASAPYSSATAATGSALQPTAGRPRVMVVGDPRQAIYSFQGADARGFEKLIQRYGGDVVSCMALTRNYRSTEVIVAACNAIMEAFSARKTPAGTGSGSGSCSVNLVPPSLHTKEGGALMGVVEARDEVHELAFLRNAIKGRVKGGANPPGLTYGGSFSHYAILCRTNKVLLEVARYLKQHGVPYTRAGSSVFKLSVVPTIIALLQLLVDPTNDSAAEALLFGLQRQLAVPVPRLLSELRDPRWDAGGGEATSEGGAGGAGGGTGAAPVASRQPQAAIVSSSSTSSSATSAVVASNSSSNVSDGCSTVAAASSTSSSSASAGTPATNGSAAAADTFRSVLDEDDSHLYDDAMWAQMNNSGSYATIAGGTAALAASSTRSGPPLMMRLTALLNHLKTLAKPRVSGKRKAPGGGAAPAPPSFATSDPSQQQSQLEGEAFVTSLKRCETLLSKVLAALVDLTPPLLTNDFGSFLDRVFKCPLIPWPSVVRQIDSQDPMLRHDQGASRL